MYARLVRWSFERLYREFAWSYDLVAASVSGGRWRDWSLTALTYARGATLELGCGTGNLQAALSNTRSVTALGLDRSPQMIDQARHKVGGAAALRLLQADARALPLATSSIDSIVATFPSEYVADLQTVAEIRRVLRPGGRVAVGLWAELSGDSLYHRLLDVAYRLSLQRSPRQFSRPATDAGGDPHPVPAAQRRLAGRLERTGLVVTHEVVAAPGGRVHFVVGTLAES